MTLGPQRWFSSYHGGVKPLSHPTNGQPSPFAAPAQPRLLACSIDSAQQRLFALRELDRKLCEDRKKPLDHLRPGSLVKSVSYFVMEIYHKISKRGKWLTLLFSFETNFTYLFRLFALWSPRAVLYSLIMPPISFSRIWRGTSLWMRESSPPPKRKKPRKSGKR